MRRPKTTAGPVCLWLLRLLLGVGACFDIVGISEMLLHVDHMRCMVGDPTWIERGKRVACVSLPTHHRSPIAPPPTQTPNSNLNIERRHHCRC
jgi:hypothetical protein